MREYDFGGWATRANLKCSDGVTIMQDAFKDNDGKTVPLVWNHQHDEPANVLGHAELENRPEGVYAYCTFNDTESGQIAKVLVKHSDIKALSIYANRLQKKGPFVAHGQIREVSLVHAGANPGAFIDSVMVHSDDDSEEFEATIYTGEDIVLAHAEDEPEKKKEDEMDPEEKKTDELEHAGEETVADVFNTLNEKQKNVVYAMIGNALEDAGKDGDDKDDDEPDTKGGKDEMKHNVFDQEDENMENNTLSHAEMKAIIDDGKRHGSLRDSAIAHGIDDVEYLFPDARNVTNTPIMISRDMGWVQKVMSGVHHTPFSRIKSIFADITEDDARAKGYIKGNLKKDEVFALLKRTTTSTTIYKKQKLDRDDVVDITDFDVVAWLKSEMRTMLDEELARAYLIGDGRLSSSDDKINEQNIRPIWKDEELFTVQTVIELPADVTADARARAFIRACVKSRKNYKGSGNPTLFTTEDMLTDCLLIEDANMRVIYDSVDKLATAMRVKEIVTVPVMENQSRTVNTTLRTLGGIIVNLQDYTVGADKGGAVNMFDDFDIDYNAQKYLIETRCSGALTKPFSAIALEFTTKP